MSYLVDSNPLLRIADPASADYAAAEHALTTLLANGEDMCVTSQNLTEFWAVATRPVSANGLGMTAMQAETEINRILAQFRLLEETPEIFGHWLRLVTTFAVKGRQIYDTRLVAVMLTHGITHLLTFNGDDFKNYTGITVVHPSTI